jgi:hypothetical protein
MIVTLMAVASVRALEPSEPHDADAIWLEPSTIDIGTLGLNVGDKFNVTAWANSSKQTTGWQIWLYFPHQYINVTRAGYTAGSKSEFFQDITTMSVALWYEQNNSTHSHIEYGEAWTSGPYRSPGYGSLCWIEFEIKAIPETPIALDISYATVAFPDDPQTWLLDSQMDYFALDGLFNAVVIPELTVLAMLALLVLATPMVLYAYKKKR